jgi:hypothetical protein
VDILDNSTGIPGLLSSFVVVGVVVVVDATVVVQIRTDHGNINRRRRREFKNKGKKNRRHIPPAFPFWPAHEEPFQLLFLRRLSAYVYIMIIAYLL